MNRSLCFVILFIIQCHYTKQSLTCHTTHNATTQSSPSHVTQHTMPLHKAVPHMSHNAQCRYLLCMQLLSAHIDYTQYNASLKQYMVESIIHYNEACMVYSRGTACFNRRVLTNINWRKKRKQHLFSK